MIYPWQCSNCEQITDVKRSVADIDIPPESCNHCCSSQFSQRVIVRPQGKVKGFILEGDTGWHDKEYTKYRSVRG